jgi:hypothetical protein
MDGQSHSVSISHSVITAESCDACSADNFFPAPAQVTVPPKLTVTGISPGRGLIGATTSSVTISGTGLSGATVTAPTGITPTVKSTTSTSLVVDLAVAANATAGNNTLTVHSSGSPPQTATTTFFVQVPTKVVRFDSPPAAPGNIGPLQTPTDGDVVSLSGTVLATHQCGVYRNLLYDVVDQSGTSIEGTYTLTETFANFSGAGTPPSDRPLSVVPGFLISDTQSLTKNAPACLGPTDNQTFDQKFFATIAGSRFDLTTVIRIERGNFSGTLKVDTTITTP